MKLLTRSVKFDYYERRGLRHSTSETKHVAAGQGRRSRLASTSGSTLIASALSARWSQLRMNKTAIRLGQLSRARLGLGYRIRVHSVDSSLG
jgi:hypothetical protein